MTESFETAKNVEMFCKSHATVGHKITDLYEEFIKFVPCASTEDGCTAFGKELLKQNKKVMADLVNRFKAFVQNNSSLSANNLWAKFIKEEEYVTEELWVFLMKKFFPDRDSGSDESAPKPRVTKIKIKKATPAPLLLQLEQKQVPPVKVEVTTPIRGRHKMLPLDWESYDLGKRVDFVKKIKDRSLRDYILRAWPEISRYLDNFKSKPAMHVYVTMYTAPSSISKETKLHLKGLVESLNSFGRARLQYIECSNLDAIEIREIK